jgi:hypothetical protein
VVPVRLARRLVTEYTRPGEVVADLTGTGTVADQAARAQRACEALARTGPDGRGESTVSGVAWADLTVTTVPATAPATIEEDLRVRDRRMRARVLFAATITRPGGIVSVITGLGHTRNRALVDPAPGVVRAASCAGLVYLQHVIALTAPICEAGLGATIPVRGDGFDPDLDPGAGEVDAGLPASVADAAATITSPAHLNVSVFRRPRSGRPVTAGDAGEVDA